MTQPAAVTRRSEGPSGPPSWLRAVGVLALLYLFLTGVGLLSEGIEALGSDVQDALFDRVDNPIAALCVGVLATVLVQSSSVTTSTIVGLVAAGQVGVEAAVPMIMGANIGTSVTNTLASVGSIRRPVEFERAVGAATVHDVFNLLSVAVLLPVELLFHPLARSAEVLSSNLVGSSGAEFESPIKAAVSAPVELVMDTVAGFADGTPLGVVSILLGLAGIFGALAFITRNMKALVADRFEATLNDVLRRGGGMAGLAVGMVATIAVQSSSITTSVLVPVAAAGLISLPALYPITLGANIGTTITALLASLATDRPEALTIALVHTLFNISGIVVFYGVPGLRMLPVRMAERLAVRARSDRRLLPIYVIGLFVVAPLVGIAVTG